MQKEEIMFKVYCGHWYVSLFDSFEAAEEFVIEDSYRFEGGLRIVECKENS